jgi:hypothetical protein
MKITRKALAATVLALGIGVATTQQASAATNSSVAYCHYSAGFDTPVQVSYVTSGSYHRIYDVKLGTATGRANSEDMLQAQVRQQNATGANYGPGEDYYFEYRPTLGYSDPANPTTDFHWQSGAVYAWIWIDNNYNAHGSTCSVKWRIV